MTTKTGYIYRYTHRASGMMYIGKTEDVEARRRKHEKSRKKGRHRRFYEALDNYGIEAFDFDVICAADNSATLAALEIAYIKVLNTLHPNGYNLQIDGKPCEETLARMSEIGKGLWQDPKYRATQIEHLKNRTPWNKGIPHSDETKEKISKARTLHYQNPENRKKQSEMRSGKKHSKASIAKMKSRTPWNKGKTNIYSEETKAKMSKAKKGKPLSPEHRRKLSEVRIGKPPGNKGKPLSTEQRHKLSKAMKGRTFSPETRKKMSEAQKEVWQQRKSSKNQT